MDRKSISILIVCGALLFLWPVLVNKILPPKPAPPHTNLVSSASSTNQTALGTNQAAIAPAQPAFEAGTNVASQFAVNTNQPEETLVVTNDNAVYTFTSRGGGLKEVELLHYPETVSALRRRAQRTNQFATLNTPAAPPVLSILGNDSLTGDGVFKLSQVPGGVHAEKVLTNGLKVVKEFRLGTNYLMSASVRMENQSRQPLQLSPQEVVLGTATPLGIQDNGQVVGMLWYNSNKVASVGPSFFNTNTTKLFFFPRTPETEYRAGSNDVVWVALKNQFFTLATMPQIPAPSVVAHLTYLPPPSREEVSSTPKAVAQPTGVTAALEYPGQTLAPGGFVERNYDIFTGPKEYKTLARIAARFNNDIDKVMEFGLFSPISKMLLLGMNWLHHRLSVSYGLTIILITVLIKIVFWPLTAFSTKSMKRMQALQPQIKAIQEKYKDEPQKVSQKTMEFYRKNKVNPLGGCLPALLQIPVFFGFFAMMRGAIELRGAHFLWMGDLSQPDTIFIIPGFNFPINPMPLLMGVTMLWQISLAPPSPGMDPAQQKMMKFMPLMILLFVYSQPSGLALYYTVQNLLTILQTKLTKSDPVLAPAAKTQVPVAPQKKNK
ncbi:membrane protein insertase YidC [Pedosphaera parvula]|uniref:Membrane protein insertase YidC n=1 Tax=Pedosphaera parvula (strain Ellin514) TaxID=320771 RepID=B9XJP0_PEDPL|nr:membrane protein insertase YidC [Pedosphaera parvula]EEF59916.1 60 kDa inner membrane insertion protein [Pedosphaera parvula Ellin514]